MNNGFEVVDLGFTFKYFDTDFTQVSITTNGYVCLGNNSECLQLPSVEIFPFCVLIGLFDFLDTSLEGSGQIYYKNLESDSLDFESVKIYLNLFNPYFEPQQIFMITYDNVLPASWMYVSYRVSFQIFLSTDFVNSFVTFKFKSCPINSNLNGLNFKKIDGSVKEIKIIGGQQCIGSNVGQKGVWVIDVTSEGKFKKFIL